MIIGKLLCILFIIVLVVLIWKTAEYFNRLPVTDNDRPLIAWDWLALVCMLVSVVIILIKI